MKLGKPKIILIKIICTILFMCFITIITINYLYSTYNLTKNEYFDLLLNDTFGNNFYIKLVEIINQNFKPLNIIEIKEKEYNTFSLVNNKIDNPLVYIYNYNEEDTYKEEYNINPSVMIASFFLSNELNKKGVNTIFESSGINEFSKNNNLEKNEAINILINEKKNTYSSLKYIINLGRSNNFVKKIIANDIKYAKISMYANDKNIIVLNKLNTCLNNKYSGISKIYIDNEYNSSINIDFGGKNTSIKEVLNSIEIFSNCFKEVI